MGPQGRLDLEVSQDSLDPVERGEKLDLLDHQDLVVREENLVRVGRLVPQAVTCRQREESLVQWALQADLAAPDLPGHRGPEVTGEKMERQAHQENPVSTTV